MTETASPTATARPDIRRPRTLAWILAAAAAWILTTATLWALRPRYGYCVDGIREDGAPFGGCIDGVDSTAALATSVVALAVLCAIIVVAILARSRARLPLLIGLSALLGVVALIGLAVTVTVPAAIPYGPYPYS